MNRVVVIDSCSDCPFFDNEYYTYNAECDKLGRGIPVGEEDWSVYPIPDDCPLPATDEEATP